MTPDLIYDQLIGMGCASRLIFSYGGNPGVGSLHRFRDAVENAWPGKLEIVEHSHAGLANAYVTCPFTGEDISVVQAVRPEVAIIHAQQADHEGNVQLWGLCGVQKEAVLAARTAIVTVEEPVDELEPRPQATLLSSWTIDAIAAVPGGAHPSYAAGYSTRDNGFYSAWDEIASDRDRFIAWMREHVLEAETAVAR